MKNKTLLGAILLVAGILIASISWRLLLLIIALTYTPVPSHQHSLAGVVIDRQLHAWAMLLFLGPPLFLTGPVMAVTGGWLIRRDRTGHQEQVLWRRLSGILQAIGLLIAGAYGLCTFSSMAGCVSLDACDAGALFVLVPLLSGIGLFFLGRMLYKPLPDPGPTDAGAEAKGGPQGGGNEK